MGQPVSVTMDRERGGWGRWQARPALPSAQQVGWVGRDVWREAVWSWDKPQTLRHEPHKQAGVGGFNSATCCTVTMASRQVKLQGATCESPRLTLSFHSKGGGGEEPRCLVEAEHGDGWASNGCLGSITAAGTLQGLRRQLS